MDAGSRLLRGILPAFLVPVYLLAEPNSPLTQGCFSHGGCMEAVLCVAFSLQWGCVASLWLLEERSRTDVAAQARRLDSLV